MPTITYKGTQKCGRNMGRIGWWTWGKPRTVSEEWLNEHRTLVDGKEFTITGHTFDVLTTTDEGNDGIPDMKWTKGDIMSWMDEKEVSYSSLNNKAKLLAKVDEHLLNPTEDSMSEGDMDNTTGDEE